MSTLDYPYRIIEFNDYSTELLKLAKKIKLIIFDVDGVLTDGSLYFDSEGNELKAFHSHDGFGIKQLQRLPIELAVITGRGGGAVEYRMKNLGIQYIYTFAKDKQKVYDKLLKELNLADKNAAFIGDDIPDLTVMERVALPIAVENATPYIKKISSWITSRRGGKGAIRDVCDLFIAAYQEIKD